MKRAYISFLILAVILLLNVFAVNTLKTTLSTLTETTEAINSYVKNGKHPPTALFDKLEYEIKSNYLVLSIIAGKKNFDSLATAFQKARVLSEEQKNSELLVELSELNSYYKNIWNSQAFAAANLF